MHEDPAFAEVAPEPPDEPGTIQPPDATRPRRSVVAIVGPLVLVALMIGVAVLAMLSVAPHPPEVEVAARPEGVDVVMAGSAPLTWDPAQVGDASSAAVVAQVWEGLTAFDPAAQVQPALAERWDVSEDGHRLTFTLRPGITFSDGTPITAQDVVDSWLRVIDPSTPGPLVRPAHRRGRRG